jgi:hypothetical protein
MRHSVSSSSEPEPKTLANERAALRGPPVSLPLVLLLLLAVGAALFLQPLVVNWVRDEGGAAGFVLVAPALFTAVIVLFALDTWRTAARLGFFPGRRLLFLAFAAVLTGLLLPDTWLEFQVRTAPAAAGGRDERLFRSKDARVRALVVEAAGRRADKAQAVPLLTRALDDRDPMVRAAAVAVIAERSGDATLDAAGARAALLSW